MITSSTLPRAHRSGRSRVPAGAERERLHPANQVRRLHTRAGDVCTFHDNRSRKSRSAPLQRTLRFQGFSPLTNPLRPAAVSSGESLAPPMGFGPLQGTFAVRFRPPLGGSSAGPASWFPSRLCSRCRGDSRRLELRRSLQEFPFGGEVHGRCLPHRADGPDSRRDDFSASSGESIARPGVPAAEAVTSAGAVLPESVRMSNS